MTDTPTRGKLLSRNEIRTNCVEFAANWASETSERAEAQTFWNELLACFGVNRRRAGALFERRARRATTGRVGRIDVFWPTVVLAEHKSAGRIGAPTGGERSAAEVQAFDYLTGGDISDVEYPRYVMTSDFATIQVTDLEAAPDGPGRTFTFPTVELPDHYDTLLFLAEGHKAAKLDAKQAEAEASVEAVSLMGTLYETILADHDTDTPDSAVPNDEDSATYRASVLLNRLLFLMAGDDNGLWPHGLFSTFVRTRTVEDGSDLGAQLAALFDVLNTPEWRRSRNTDPAMAEFPYVNGGIFNTRDNPAPVMFFNRAIRDALLRCCDFNWARISPAIFGSLFQAIKSRQARHSDGEHYTSEANILRTLDPLFLDSLRDRLERTNTVRGLRELWREIGTYRYMDPACGCGNFLVVAYREMRELELDLLVKLRELDGGQTPLLGGGDLRVRLDQFYGIELNWWPAKIAETAMFLVDHQANRRMETELGMAPQRLPIAIAARIVHSNALTTDWEVVCPTPPEGRTYVFGNPPFVATTDRTAAQNTDMEAAWGRLDGLAYLDFVTSWHAKTLEFFGGGRTGEWAYVTTSSITQGAQPALLFGPIFGAGWNVKFGHKAFTWRNEGRGRDTAGVHVVIIGFTREHTKGRLFTYPHHSSGEPVEVAVTDGVNAYLADGPRTLVEKRTRPFPGMPPVNYGSKPVDGGNLIVEPGDYQRVAGDPIAAKYLRRFVGTRELLYGEDRWCLWLVDLDPADVHHSTVLRERLAAVRTERAKSTKPQTRALADTPHLFAEIRQTDASYLCIPRHVGEGRRYFTAARLDSDVIASDAVFTCPDPDGFVFAVSASSMFITWQKTIGGRIRADIRFANTLTWNTFPLPDITAQQRSQIIAAGEAVVAARRLHPERSLEQHYDPLAMDAVLVRAHDALDSVLDRAFGASRRCTSETERQRLLFARYVELTANSTTPTATKKRHSR